MIRVFHTDGKHFEYANADGTMSDENGWLYIIGFNGLTIASHPRDKVDRVLIEAGETEVTSDNPKDGN